MDKRWIYILAIMIIGFACLFLIVDSSTTLAKANVKISGCTVTLPSTLNVHDSGGKFLNLTNRDNGEHIFMEATEKGDNVKNTFIEKMNTLKNDPSIENLTNSTSEVDNCTVMTAEYKTAGNDTLNQISVFFKFKNTFVIKCSDYDNQTTMEDNAEFLIKTMKIDYKQKQD